MRIHNGLRFTTCYCSQGRDQRSSQCPMAKPLLKGESKLMIGSASCLKGRLEDNMALVCHRSNIYLAIGS